MHHAASTCESARTIAVVAYNALPILFSSSTLSLAPDSRHGKGDAVIFLSNRHRFGVLRVKNMTNSPLTLSRHLALPLDA
jgi:hypothetical protein